MGWAYYEITGNGILIDYKTYKYSKFKVLKKYLSDKTYNSGQISDCYDYQSESESESESEHLRFNLFQLEWYKPFKFNFDISFIDDFKILFSPLKINKTELDSGSFGFGGPDRAMIDEYREIVDMTEEEINKFKNKVDLESWGVFMDILTQLNVQPKFVNVNTIFLSI